MKYKFGDIVTINSGFYKDNDCMIIYGAKIMDNTGSVLYDFVFTYKDIKIKGQHEEKYLTKKEL